MIIKKRTKPLALQKLEAVIPRLSPHFSNLSELQSDLARRYKGYIGEHKVDRHLGQFADKCTILQDVCLKVDGKEFQIDGMVITSHAIYCIEMKNFNGQIIFNTTLNQFTRSDGKVETGFNHPIAQAEFHQFQLTKWLHTHNLHDIAISYFIAVSDPGTIIKVIGDEEAIGRKVTHGAFIPKKIIAEDEMLQAGGQPKLNHAKIGQAILQANKLYDRDNLGKFDVLSDDILTGVHCPGCGELGMERMYGMWKCPACGDKSKHAHQKAISDYLLLINPWLNNKQCRHFLRINSRALATRLLKRSGLQHQSDRKRWVKPVNQIK